MALLIIFAVSLLVLAQASSSSRPAHYNIVEPTKYVLDFPMQDNPMDIPVVEPYSKNYLMVIGDWGAESEENHKVQTAIAQKMKAYYNAQLAQGYNLLLVVALGDNFYYTGQDCKTEFEKHWSNVYGSNLTSVPWIANLGNHDWGDSDPYAMCPWNNTKYVDPVTNMPYASNQLNVAKKGCNPTNFYMPDFTYYYTINELGLEIIALEESTHDCPGGIGGGYGNGNVFKNCEDPHSNKRSGEDIGCGYLKKIADSGEAMMDTRAKVSNNTNFLLTNHYPSQGKRLLNSFLQSRSLSAFESADDLAWSMYGHTHKQRCDQQSAKNADICEVIMSGGGGGCCLEFSLRGFFVIGFDDNKHMTQPLALDDPLISCEYPCNTIQGEEQNLYVNYGFETCCHTSDAAIDCSVYDLSKCAKKSEL